MPFARLSQRTNLWMRKVNTWLSEEELEAINKVRGDISISLWIRRQIRNALSEGEASNQTPKAAYATESVATTATTSQRPSKSKEINAT